MRRTEAPITRLRRKEKLNIWEDTAADELMNAYCIVQGVDYIRNPELGITESNRAGAANAEEVRRIDSIDKLREWQADLKQTSPMIAVTAILFGERSFGSVERENRWRRGEAFGYFRAGLRHFAALRGNTPRGEKWRYNR